MEGEFNTESFKVQLNNFMLMHAPEFMTIGEAENAMLALVSEVEKTVRKYENSRTACIEADLCMATHGMG